MKLKGLSQPDIVSVVGYLVSFVPIGVQFKSPWLRHVIAQTVGWKKPDPIHEMEITVGESTNCHLR